MAKHKRTRFSFAVNIHKNSTHWVSVQIHRTTAAMRSYLTKLGHKDSSHTDGACWQANKPGIDHCIAEIHFSKPLLNLETIAHEASHAAFHRAILIGVPYEHKDFQEFLSEDTGVITEAIIAMCDKNKIPVHYRKIKRRML